MNETSVNESLKKREWALLFFLFGAHYLYIGKPGLQLLFWITMGGLGIWWLIDLFNMEGKIKAANTP